MGSGKHILLHPLGMLRNVELYQMSGRSSNLHLRWKGWWTERKGPEEMAQDMWRSKLHLGWGHV